MINSEYYTIIPDIFTSFAPCFYGQNIYISHELFVLYYYYYRAHRNLYCMVKFYFTYIFVMQTRVHSWIGRFVYPAKNLGCIRSIILIIQVPNNY